MAGKLLVDTDILIDYLRGHPRAVRFVTESADDIVVSAMSVAELFAGVRGEAHEPEQHTLRDFLELFAILPVTATIAKTGGIYRRDYAGSHGVGLADAIIAATADAAEATLQTLNVRHYPMFPGIEPAYRK
ncbi:MAG: type II toxin-antitoxin system VapC family toxin [Gammaproteobacteria bacterium]|nr:type II toxin-antitoxin system VapC family toxin [Gammaproteobacteria bacterium]